MRATYTAASDAKLQEWALQGVPVKEQARRLGVKEATVVSWRRRLGMTKGYPPVTPELDAKIKGWIADGWPLKEIAETAGIGLQQVRAQYPGAGIDTCTQGLLGAAVRTAVRVNPYIMRGLR